MNKEKNKKNQSLVFENKVNSEDLHDEVIVSSVLSPLKLGEIQLPLFLESVSAGFPSPAEDYIEGRLDLNDFLIRNPSSTYFVRVKGDSLLDSGIHENDILVVDRSKKPKDGSIVIAVVNGELLVKILQFQKSKIFLLANNKKYSSIEVTESMDLVIWGTVTTVIHPVD